MIWVLNRTLYRPLNRIMESRDKNKGGRSSEAVSILKAVNEKEAFYSKELFDTRSVGYELTEKEQKAATKAREKKLSKVKAEVADKFAGGKAELDREVAEAHAAIRVDADKIADSIAANILQS